jgi:hypothetical protein
MAANVVRAHEDGYTGMLSYDVEKLADALEAYHGTI